MKCEICECRLLRDCQFINGKYYHNKCIEKLIEENQSLKNQLQESEFKIANLTMDKIELKKQNEEYKRLGFKHLNDKCNKLNQQKEFIEYMENYIKEMSIQNINSHPSRQIILKVIIDTLKDNLSKYKEIIGGKDE